MPESDSPEAVLPLRPNRSRLDRILNLGIVGLVCAILAFAGWFGYSVWTQRQYEKYSSPAMRAVYQLQQRARQDPNDSELLVRLGEALETAGLDNEAIKSFQSALKLDPKHSGAYLDLGIVSMNRGETKAAESYFQKVLDLTAQDNYQLVNQRREIAYFNLGVIASKGKRFDDAVGYFKAALRIRGDSSDTYYNLALAYESLDARDKALQQLEIAITFDPNYAAAQYEMAKLYLQDGDKINAAVHLQVAAKHSPNVKAVKEMLATLGSASSWIGKARQALAANDLDGAVEDVLIARALEPENLEAAKLHAQVLEKKGNLKGALTVWREAQELAPNDPEAKASITRLSGVKGS